MVEERRPKWLRFHTEFITRLLVVKGALVGGQPPIVTITERKHFKVLLAEGLVTLLGRAGHASIYRIERAALKRALVRAEEARLSRAHPLPAMWQGAQYLAVSDERNRAIVEARLAGATLEAVGQQNGITRERVRQIQRRHELFHGLPHSTDHFVRCPRCGTRFLYSGKGTRYGVVCKVCLDKRRSKTCKVCGGLFHGRGRAYCETHRYETRPCDACGKAITRDRGLQGDLIRNQHWFCDRRCHGRWFGRNFGRRKQ